MTSRSSSAAYNYYAMALDPRLVPVLGTDAARPRLALPVSEARARSTELQQRLRDAHYRPGPEPAATLDLQVPVEVPRSRSGATGPKGGESARANLAAVVALMARDRRGPEISLQVLSVAVTDLTGSQPSVEEFAQGYLLSRAGMRTQREHYLGDAVDPRHHVTRGTD